MSNNSAIHDKTLYAPTGQAIGVFDSGVGGLSVLRHIQARLPNESLIYVADSLYAPYGNQTPAAIRARCFAVADFLIQQSVKALVVACNTATAAAITDMREKYHALGLDLPIIGMEPAVKPAVAATKSGVIGVLATVGTLKSAQFAALLASYGHEVKIITQGCPGLVECVEQAALTEAHTLSLVEQYCAPLLAAGADTIVLGCTHYPFLQPLIAQVVGPDVALIETGQAVARQVQHRLMAAQLLNHSSTSCAPVSFWTNSPREDAHRVIRHLWQASAQEKACASTQAFNIQTF